MSRRIRIEVRGFINTSWEGTDAQATKYLAKLRDLQAEKVKAHVGESTVNKHMKECKRLIAARRPSAPKGMDAFPLTIKIN